MKYIFFVFCLCFVFNFASAKESDTLIVCMELAYPPFEMSDKNGVPIGVSVDMAKAIGESLNKKIKIENISFDGLIPSLKTGKIDMIISSMSITDERAKSIDFSNPYAKSYLALLVSKKSSIKNHKELNKKGVKIAIKRGTTAHILATTEFPLAEILVFDKENAAILEVSQGKVDAFIYDQLSVFRAQEQYGNSTNALLAPIESKSQNWGIAVKKDNKALLESVNKFLLDFNKQGGFNQLSQKYLSKESKVFKEQNIPFFFDVDAKK